MIKEDIETVLLGISLGIVIGALVAVVLYAIL